MQMRLKHYYVYKWDTSSPILDLTEVLKSAKASWLLSVGKTLWTYLQGDLPGPGVRPRLVPRHNPLSHVGFEVGHSTVLGPVWEGQWRQNPSE